MFSSRPDKDYKLITLPQNGQRQKIEVVEFFSTRVRIAPISSRVDDLKRKPRMRTSAWSPWSSRKGRRLPSSSTPWKPWAEKMHRKVYDAIRKENQQLFTDQAVIDWAAKQGLDKAKFEQIYNSFGVDTKVQRSVAMGRAYGVQFTPAIAVGGKYWTGPSMVVNANGNADLPLFFNMVDQLIAMERGKSAATTGSPAKKKG
jgi:hypothetical protein